MIKLNFLINKIIPKLIFINSTVFLQLNNFILIKKMKMIMKLSIPFLFALIFNTMSLKIKNNSVQDLSDSSENIEAEVMNIHNRK